MTYLEAEPWDSFMNLVVSDPQTLASRRAVEQSYSPSAEPAFSKGVLWAELHDKRTTAQVLYDSLAQQRAAGTRSIAMRVRQMLYRADPYQIDLQVEVQPDRNRLIVTGQVIDVGPPDILDAGIEVTLSDGRGNIVNAVTNQFGEFRGEVVLTGDLELSFHGRDGRPVVVLLRGTLDSASGGKN